MKHAEEILKELGLDANEEAERLETTRRRKRDERIICSCGHAKARHTLASNFSVCNPSAMSCPCAHWTPVLKVTDTRPFMWKTTGLGAEHALTKGIIAMHGKNISGEWLPDAYKCIKCSTTVGVNVYPIQKTAERLLIASDYELASLNLMLCEPCKDNL